MHHSLSLKLNNVEHSSRVSRKMFLTVIFLFYGHAIYSDSFQLLGHYTYHIS